MKRKVIAYFDGHNFYEGIRNKGWKKYYWQDIVTFTEQFLKKDQELVEVKYFSAIQKDAGKASRQDKFFQANRQNPKFHLILGKFRPRKRWRNVKVDGKRVGVEIQFWEEKKSDVALGCHMVRDICLGNCDTIMLFSADSDFTPALNLCREVAKDQMDLRIVICFPPSNFSSDLHKKANIIHKLEDHEPKFSGSQLPGEITLQNGYVLKKPTEWQ